MLTADTEHWPCFCHCRFGLVAWGLLWEGNLRLQRGSSYASISSLNLKECDDVTVDRITSITSSMDTLNTGGVRVIVASW